MRRPDIRTLEKIIRSLCHQEVENMITGDEEAKTGFFLGLFVLTGEAFAQFVLSSVSVLLHLQPSIDPTDAVSIASPPDF